MREGTLRVTESTESQRLTCSLPCPQLEQLKLLSTAEKLGLFSLAEKVLTSDPGAISSASIPFFIAAIGRDLLTLLIQTIRNQPYAHITPGAISCDSILFFIAAIGECPSETNAGIAVRFCMQCVWYQMHIVHLQC